MVAAVLAQPPASATPLEPSAGPGAAAAACELDGLGEGGPDADIPVPLPLPVPGRNRGRDPRPGFARPRDWDAPPSPARPGLDFGIGDHWQCHENSKEIDLGSATPTVRRRPATRPPVLALGPPK